MRALVMMSATCLLSACPDRSLEAVTPTASIVTVKDLSASPDLDLLFVIDNSSSTLDKQALFAANFGHILAPLTAFSSGLPNLHVGVIDTTVDIGVKGFGGCPSPDPLDDGLLQMPSCGVNGRFISDVATAKGRETNYAGTLADSFSCVASLGASGCGFESPLKAIERALDPSRSDNAGFLRHGAFLAIVILTDEDDASVKDNSVFMLDDATYGHDDFRVQPLFAYRCDQPISPSIPGSYTGCAPRTDSYLSDPASTVQFLASVEPPAQTVVAVIASPPPHVATNDSPPQAANVNTDAIVTGPLALNGQTQAMALQPSTTCTINGKTAIGRPAVRLASFAQAYGERGRFYNVCQADYSAAMADIGQTLFAALSPCLPGSVQLPLDCAVTDIVDRGAPDETQAQVPACPMIGDAPDPAGPRPCWWALHDAAACPLPSSGYELKIERAAAPATGTITEAQCVAAS